MGAENNKKVKLKVKYSHLYDAHDRGDKKRNKSDPGQVECELKGVLPDWAESGHHGAPHQQEKEGEQDKHQAGKRKGLAGPGGTELGEDGEKNGGKSHEMTHYERHPRYHQWVEVHSETENSRKKGEILLM